MGQERLTDKTIRPATTVAYSLSPANAVESRARGSLGVLPIGYYKGEPRFWDLDLAVNQPNVWAEQQHILGMLDGREEDHDLQTLAITLAEAIGTTHSAALTVPTGEVWYITGVEGIIPASGGANIIDFNWRCSLWPDRVATPNVAGQTRHAVNVNFGAGGGTQFDEFGVLAVWWVLTNKPVALRLPAGESVACTFTNTGVVAAATVNCLFRLNGYIGKTLVV